MTIDQLNDYGIWFRLGMVLKRSGASPSLWDGVSRRSHKYKPGDCANEWGAFNRRSDDENEVIIGSLHQWVQRGHTEMHNRIKQTLKTNTHAFADEVVYPAIEIDTPFLTSKTGGTPQPPDQDKFQRLTDETMDDPSKTTLVGRGRYGSGKTTYRQRLIKAWNPQPGLLYNLPADPSQRHHEKFW